MSLIDELKELHEKAEALREKHEQELRNTKYTLDGRKYYNAHFDFVSVVEGIKETIETYERHHKIGEYYEENLAPGGNEPCDYLRDRD